MEHVGGHEGDRLSFYRAQFWNVPTTSPKIEGKQ